MDEIKSEKLQALFDSYREDLKVQVKNLQQLWARLKSEWSFSEAKEFEMLCHKIAGAAPTFGFEEVGVRARLIEHVLRENNLQHNNASPQHISDIDHEFVALAAAAPEG